VDSHLAPALVLPLGADAPRIAPGAFIAPTAVVAGDVRIDDEASVWYTTVVRADVEAVVIGEGSNLQDGTVVHADPGYPATVGRGVSVGHRAVLHGCTIGDDVLVGMGAVVLNGASVGSGSLVAAGAVVLGGTEVPPGSLVAGVPGKVRRETTADEREMILGNARIYRELAERHRRAVTG
jgi:carbonic anhydrase/acetyltransferase-like protein (isoleucine patch superfamily)